MYFPNLSWRSQMAVARGKVIFSHILIEQSQQTLGSENATMIMIMKEFKYSLCRYHVLRLLLFTACHNKEVLEQQWKIDFLSNANDDARNGLKYWYTTLGKGSFNIKNTFTCIFNTSGNIFSLLYNGSKLPARTYKYYVTFQSQ